MLLPFASSRRAIALLTTVWAVAASAQTDRRTLSGSAVSVYNLAGRMSVEAGSGTDIVVEVTRRGRDAGDLRIETGDLEGRNTLRVVYPDGDVVYPSSTNRSSSSEMRVYRDGSWGRSRRDGRRVRVSTRGPGNEVWADVRILVPAGKSLDAHLGVGELSATGVNATLRLETSAGKLTASGIRGALDVDAGSGGVDLREVDVTVLGVDVGSGGVNMTDIVATTCTIDSGSGGVTATRANCRELKVDVGSGGIRMTSVRATDVRVDAGSGGVQLSLVNSPTSANIEAGSGGVTLTVPAELSAELDIESGSGGIDTDFPLRTNRLERNRVRGTVGQGEGRIRIETGSGPIRLRRN